MKLNGLFRKWVSFIMSLQLVSIAAWAWPDGNPYDRSRASQKSSLAPAVSRSATFEFNFGDECNEAQIDKITAKIDELWADLFVNIESCDYFEAVPDGYEVGGDGLTSARIPKSRLVFWGTAQVNVTKDAKTFLANEVCANAKSQSMNDQEFNTKILFEIRDRRRSLRSIADETCASVNQPLSQLVIDRALLQGLATE